MQRDARKAVEAVATIPSVGAILDVVCRMTGMGFAAVARVTDDRWIACSVLDRIDFGLKEGDELELESTICHEIREHRQPVLIHDVDADPLYASHHTPKRYGLKSYISVPITLADGSFFGTLCAIDPQRHDLSAAEILTSFTLFASLIAAQLDAQTRVQAAEARATVERQRVAAREQFVAILGHDLRNPLSSIAAGTRLLERQPLDERGGEILSLMSGSAARMFRIINNVMDFAQSGVTNSIPVEMMDAVNVSDVVSQVVEEMRTIHPDRSITSASVAAEAKCDPVRLGQLLSNLLGNAIKHGAEEGEVRLVSAVDEGHVTFSVTNSGKAIPKEQISSLFRPFVRGKGAHETKGLGLGLYICSQIAKAHRGSLGVSSTDAETCFTFRLPLT